MCEREKANSQSCRAGRFVARLLLKSTVFEARVPAAAQFQHDGQEICSD